MIVVVKLGKAYGSFQSKASMCCHGWVGGEGGSLKWI